MLVNRRDMLDFDTDSDSLLQSDRTQSVLESPSADELARTSRQLTKQEE